jgi:DNA-binding CsgD family transcriptional regulator
MEGRAAAASFVGRTGELEKLEGALASAAAGRGSTFLIAGEAGIGKTRLVLELADRARTDGTTVLTGRCIDLVGTGLAYLPLVEALRPLRHSSAVAGVPGGLRELSRLVPELARPPTSVPIEGDAALSQVRLFEELLAVLERLSTAAPLLLVLEDLHWADASTLDLVAFLAHAAGAERIVIVGTYRSDELGPAAALQGLVTEFLRDREATVLELGPLDREDIELLVLAADPETRSAELASTIYTRSEGNPFFAEELLAAAARDDETLPRVLRDALLQRVARLDAVSRSVLRMAAAAGRDVPYALLAAVISLPEQKLLTALEQAVEHGVLVPDQSARAFRFRHALLAEAVYATLLPGEREAVHGRLASALAANPTLVASRTATGEVAQHWAAAGRPVEALVASVQAASDAEAVSGLAEALQHLERVLQLWEQVPEAEELTALALPDLLAQAAELADLTGNGRRAAALTHRAIELLEEDTDPRRLGLLYERLGSYLLPWGARRDGLAAFERAVELVPVDPPSAGRVRVLAALGNALALSWRHADSRAVCEQAVAIADAIEDDRPALRAMSVLGVDLCYLGRPADGMRTLHDARRRARTLGSPRDVTHSYVMLCEVLVATGRLHEAAETALEGLAIARPSGLERSYGILLAAYAGEAFLETGDWAQANEVLAAALPPGAEYWSHYPNLLRAQLAIGRGELEEARQHLAAGGQGAREPTSAARYARLTAELALWEGRPEEAASVIEGSLLGPETGAPLQRARLAALGLQAEAERLQIAAVARDAAAVASARRRAQDLLAEACRSTENAAVMSPNDASAWRAVAEAEHSRVESRSSPERWDVAVAAWDELERPYLAACCRWRHAEALVADGRSADAAVAARSAYRVASRLGARSLRRELQLLAARARLDLVGLRAEDAHQSSAEATALGLTPREREVLQLLARGYTNREIAAELVISVKTASVHVSHILRKLDVSSRVDAARIAHRLAPPPATTTDS